MNAVIADVAWGDAATWAAAGGTLAAVVVALGIALRDTLRQRWRDRRWQAEQVTAWLGGRLPTADMSSMSLRLHVGNASRQSVYQVIATLVAIQGAWRRDGREGGIEHRTFLWQVSPGDRAASISFSGHGMMLRFGIELAFQDAAGRNWRRLADGRLEEIAPDPVDFYGVSRPVGWEDNTFDLASDTQTLM